MEINIYKKVKVQAKTLKIHTKVCDDFSFTIHDQDGEEIFEQDHDYVPDFFPGDHYGDYLILDIDLDTGRILNWEPPMADQIQELINKKAGDEDHD